ncbi:hypothetical protein WJX81_000909 [Elliptochloris bilobata]|uniref:Mediator of RNA polymerase II transcription subunit 4 n=1 Tax=Elliptochloris bilobata TaxID=381761 RepID=A0AAW1SL66_9CHLO
MDASTGSSRLHDQLESLVVQCPHWSLETDRQLLAALQDMSSGLMASLQSCRASVDSVAKDAEAAAVNVAAATSQLRLLSHKRFIQQRTTSVAESLPRREQPQPPTSAAALSADNFDEVVHPLYCEALAIAAAALSAPPLAATPRPLPFLFGSPEYLQDPHGGLGPLIPGWQPPPPIGANPGDAEARLAKPSADASEELVFGASEDASSWSGGEATGPHGRGGQLPGGLFDDEEALELEDLRGVDLGGKAAEPPGAQLEGLGSGALQALGSSSLNLDDAELLASLRALTGSRG